MKNFLSMMIASAAIAIFPCQAIAQSEVTIPEIKEQAQGFTVKIEPPSGKWGSGVIIGQNGDTYYVLTAAHVVKDVNPGEELYLLAFDGTQQQEYAVDVSTKKLLPHKVDLALIEFESQKQYGIATISTYNYPLYEHRDYEIATANDASSQQHQVFAAGWPLNRDSWDICQGEPLPESCQQPVFSPGFLFDNSATAISQPSISNPDDDFGGYELIYTNLTYPGMSGGAILDSSGRLIGIHGRADGREIGREDKILARYLDEIGKDTLAIKIGLSLGLPIKTFLTSATGQEINSYLSIEDSPPPIIELTDLEAIEAPQLVTDDTNPYHWIEKGNRLWRIGEPAMARGSFTRAIALQADLYLAWFAQGFAAGFNQQYDQALASCDRAITLNVSPNNIKYESYRCRAGALQQLERPEEALMALDDALEIDNSNPADLMLRGELNFALGDYEGALTSFNRAVTMRKTQQLPDSALLYNNIALVKLKLEQYDAALAETEKAISLDANFAPAYRNQGLILELMDRNEESLVAYERALQLNPEDYNAWTNKGFALYKLQRIDEAKRAFNQALEINPDYQPAINNLKAIE